MPHKRHTPEQIISKLRGANVLITPGSTSPVAAKQIGITVQTFDRWRLEYGGMKPDQAKRLKELVADLSLDNAVLKEAMSGDY